MTDVSFILTPRAPFADLSTAADADCGVTITCRDGLGVATVLVRKGQGIALAKRLREHFQIELPEGPRRTAVGDLALAGTGPEGWLVTSEQGGNAFSGMLRRAIADVASVSDQTDAYAILRLSGPRVRDTLCKLVPIDVHPRTFKVGDVAVTVAAHLGATLWRLEDRADGSAVFEVAVFRSMAESFSRALAESAAEFGFA